MPSTSAKQHRFMAAIAHSPSFAKKVGVSQSVGKDFDAADKGKTFKKGGMMKKRKFDEGGETSAHEIDSDSRRAHGLYDEEPTPKSATKVVPKVAKRKMDDMGAQNVSANKSIADKSEMGPQEDTGAVTGMASRKYKFKGTDADKERNATNLAKELVTTAALGGVGKLGQAVYRVGKAANVARHFGEAKQLAAPEAAAWKEFAATPRKAIKTPSAKKFEKQINSGEIALKKGGDVKNFKSLFKGKETYGEELKEAKAIKSGKISPQQYAKGEDMEKTKKYAKGGGIESRGKTKGTIIRMAMGGSVSSASRRADGIAQRGKTKC